MDGHQASLLDLAHLSLRLKVSRGGQLPWENHNQYSSLGLYEKLNEERVIISPSAWRVPRYRVLNTLNCHFTGMHCHKVCNYPRVHTSCWGIEKYWPLYAYIPHRGGCRARKPISGRNLLHVHSCDMYPSPTNSHVINSYLSTNSLSLVQTQRTF